MIITTSKRIRKRLISGLVGIIFFLVVGVILQGTRNHYVIEKGGIFIPLNFVNQSQLIYKAINDELKPTNPIIFPCGDLAKSALREKISDLEKINIEASESKLNQLWTVYTQNNLTASCKIFPEILSAAYKLKNAIATEPNTPVEIQAKQLYSQNLNWNNATFCLYGKDRDGIFLLSGRPQDCQNSNFKDYDKNLSRSALQKNISPLINLAKNRSTLDLSKSNLAKQITLTINPNLQFLADSISNCINSTNNCSDPIRSEIQDIKNASFTIMNADTSEILAVGCIGPLCNSKSNSSLGLLAGANIEAPPASTEKLVFSYAIAQNHHSSASQLEFQIKTSGQIDGNVSKRNEWWEKQVICDSKTEKNKCPIALEALSFAKKIGWNQNCGNEPNLLCGNSSIFTPLGIMEFSPVSGRIMLSSDKRGIYLDEKNISGPYLSWPEYDQIRQGKIHPKNYKKLEATSLLVQSVIGAGNNRVTSLGLAMLSSSIYQSATYGKTKQVSLFTNPENKIEETHTSSKAGKMVLNGMRKVVTPAEKGWGGDGTANNSFKYAFGKSCNEKCPIFAKTGTVTHQDQIYGGTTLFTSTINTQELSKELNIKQNQFTSINLSIGVIVNPNKKVKIHQASRLGMLIIKEIVSHNE